jgi:hypothetical protein
MVFSANNAISAPDTRVSFVYGFVLFEKFDYQIADYAVSGVNDTADR